MIFSLSSKVICLFLIALSFSNAKLIIKSPEELSKKFNAAGIDYTILTPQNKITYKKIFIGSLTLPEGENANACEALPSLSGLKDDVIYNPILLTTWGDCHYAQKVKNAEIAGAKMVILILRHDLEANHALVRQLPISTSVEVLCISKKDGDELVNYINANRDNRDKTIELTYSYEVERHVNFQAGSDVILDFWFSSGDLSKASYQFLDSLYEILKDFTGHVKFNPRYVVWSYEGASQDDPKCILNGKYCDPERYTKDRLSGKEAIYEDLRQICLKEGPQDFNLNSEWWKYVSAFGSECIDKDLDEIESCRSNIFKTLPAGTERTVQNCIDNSLSRSEVQYLQKEADDREKQSIDHYPAFYVNKERYTGSFRNKYAIKEFICSHFIQDKIPDTCLVAANPTQTTTTSSSDTLLYILIVLVSVLIMALMLYCVRRSAKRQVIGRMNEEISHIVTQYKQFKDKSNSFADEEN